MSCVEVIHPVKVLLGVGSLRVQGHHVVDSVHKVVTIKLLDGLIVGVQPVQHQPGAKFAAANGRVQVPLVLISERDTSK